MVWLASYRVRVFLGLLMVLSIWTVIANLGGIAREDFFPVWFGGTQLEYKGTLYGPESTAFLSGPWNPTVSTNLGTGNAYPLPLILIFLPFSTLPFLFAHMVLCFLTIGIIAWVSPTWKVPWYTWITVFFLSEAAYVGFAFGNITFILFGFVMLLIWSDMTDHPGIGVASSAIVVWKPQLALLFVGIYMLRRIREGRWWIPITAGSLMLFFTLLGMLLDPSWIQGWLKQTSSWTGTYGFNLLPWWAWFSLLACWKRPWWVTVSMLSMLLFPYVSPYSMMPLLLYWIARSPRIGLLGSAASFFGFFLGGGESAWMLIPVILDGIIHVGREGYHVIRGRRETSNLP